MTTRDVSSWSNNFLAVTLRRAKASLGGGLALGGSGVPRAKKHAESHGLRGPTVVV